MERGAGLIERSVPEDGTETKKSKNRKGFGSEFAMQKHMVFGNVICNFLAFYAVTKTSTPCLSKSASSKTHKTL